MLNLIVGSSPIIIRFILGVYMIEVTFKTNKEILTGIISIIKNRVAYVEGLSGYTRSDLQSIQMVVKQLEDHLEENCTYCGCKLATTIDINKHQSWCSWKHAGL